MYVHRRIQLGSIYKCEDLGNTKLDRFAKQNWHKLSWEFQIFSENKIDKKRLLSNIIDAHVSDSDFEFDACGVTQV